MDRGAGNQRTAIVTGASRGIGAQICKDLSDKGYDVWGVARSSPEDDSSDISPNTEINWLKCDLASSEERTDLIHDVQRNMGKVDLLVFCAGVANSKSAEKTTDQDIELEMQVNFVGHVALLRELEPLLRQSSDPHVVAIGSLTGELAFPGNCSYAASKAALFHYLRSWKLENPFFRKRVKMVLPGFVRTQMNEGFDVKDSFPEEETRDISKAVLRSIHSWKFVHFGSWTSAAAYYMSRVSHSMSDAMIRLIRRRSITMSR